MSRIVVEIYRSVTYQGDTILMKPCQVLRSDVCHHPDVALEHAQTSFFISIIIVQWGDILACKTRTLSLKHQGMRWTLPSASIRAHLLLCA